MGRDEAGVVRSVRPLGVKNADILIKKDNKLRPVQNYSQYYALKVISLTIYEGVGSFYK